MVTHLQPINLSQSLGKHELVILYTLLIAILCVNSHKSCLNWPNDKTWEEVLCAREYDCAFFISDTLQLFCSGPPSFLVYAYAKNFTWLVVWSTVCRRLSNMITAQLFSLPVQLLIEQRWWGSSHICCNFLELSRHTRTSVPAYLRYGRVRPIFYKLLILMIRLKWVRRMLTFDVDRSG